MPKLTVSLPDGTDTVHDLTDDLITVGRIDENSIEIVDPSVSSRHAQLSRDGGDYVLLDLGSTNGNRVNGREAPEGEDFRLGDNDTVIFGNVNVLYTSENPAPSRPMPLEEGVSSVPAAASARPANFANASPFQTKQKGRDPVGVALIVASLVALAAAGGAVFMILQMPPAL